MLDFEALGEAVAGRRDKAQRLARAPHGDEVKPVRGARLGHALARLAIHVHHGRCPRRQKLAKQAELLREVLLETRVVVQMIPRDVGEGARGKLDAVDAALLQPMARCFERKMGDARSRKLGEDRVQGDGVGCRMGKRLGARRRNHADGAEACRAEALALPELAREGGDRGLAVGAGDGDLDLRLRAEEARGDERKPPARIGILDHRRPVQLRARRPLPARIAAAPFWTASAMKRAPSVFTPGRAAKR